MNFKIIDTIYLYRLIGNHILQPVLFITCIFSFNGACLGNKCWL